MADRSHSATKAGQRFLSLALAEELRATTVRVCTVSPGPVDTGFIMTDPAAVSDLTFSQPVSSAEAIADAVWACALDGRPERKVPAVSGVLTTVSYVVPAVARWLRPVLEKVGRRRKAKLAAERG